MTTLLSTATWIFGAIGLALVVFFIHAIDRNGSTVKGLARRQHAAARASETGAAVFSIYGAVVVICAASQLVPFAQLADKAFPLVTLAIWGLANSAGKVWGAFADPIPGIDHSREVAAIHAVSHTKVSS